MSTAAWVVSNWDPSRPSSMITLNTPGGAPAASAASAKASAESGVRGLGRRMTEDPVNSGGMAFHMSIQKGKL